MYLIFINKIFYCNICVVKKKVLILHSLLRGNTGGCKTWELRKKRVNIEIIAIKINSKHKGNKTEGRVETRQEE